MINKKLLIILTFLAIPQIQANRFFRFMGKNKDLVELAQFSNHWTRATLENKYAYDSINRRFDYAKIVKDNPYAKLSTLDQVSQELNDSITLIDKKINSKFPAPGIISNTFYGIIIGIVPTVTTVYSSATDGKSVDELLINAGAMAAVSTCMSYFNVKKAVQIKNEWPQKLENLQENQTLITKAAKDFTKNLPVYLQSQGFSNQKATRIASVMAGTASKNKNFFRFFRR